MNNRVPDVVFPLKIKSQYEELRYSLRSLANVPHGRVFVAGAKPEWLTNAIHIPVSPKGPQESRFQNAERNWMAACSHPDLADDFIAMNDDFFILKPVKSIRYYHDGPLQEYLEYRQSLGDTPENYLLAMQTAGDILRDFHVKDPLGYTLHVPMVMNKWHRLALHAMFERQINAGQILLMRTLYGNLFNCGGRRMIDVKFVNDRFSRRSTFLSSNDQSFKNGELGEFIRSKFPNKSPYER